MTGGASPPDKTAAKSEARVKIATVGISAIISIPYSLLTLPMFVPENHQPGGPVFVALLIVEGALFLVGVISWYEVLPDYLTPPRLPSVWEEKVLGGLLYLLSVLYIVTLCWITVFTGGPVTSPYAVILLTVAVLSSAVARRPKATVAVVGFILTAYAATDWIYHARHTPDVHPSDALVIVTAIVGVVISVGLELARRKYYETNENQPAPPDVVAAAGDDSLGSNVPAPQGDQQ